MHPTSRVASVAVVAAVLFGCHKTPEEPEPAVRSADIAVQPPNSAPSPKPSCPADTEPNLPPVPVKSITFTDALSGPITVQAEIVSSPHDTERGLMYRTHMDEDRGMLFQLDRRDHAFWMKNTCISLDLVYIDDDRIVGIIESAPILNEDQQSVGAPSTEVLELNAGFCKRHGVRAGQRVVLPLRPR